MTGNIHFLKLFVAALLVPFVWSSCEGDDDKWKSDDRPVIVRPSDEGGSGKQQGEDTSGETGDPSVKPGDEEEETPPTPPPAARVSFSNPVLINTWADPTIWYDGTTFYTASTGNGKFIFSSPDLVHWTKTTAKAMKANSIPAAETDFGDGSRGFWAPDVVKVGNEWRFYVTFHGDNTDSNIGMFTCSTAAGPFVYSRIITRGKETGINTIDPEVVQDPSTGKWWMFFGSSRRIHRVELNADASAIAEGAVYVPVAGRDIQYDSSRRTVFEGPYVYYHDGWWYLFASAGKYANASYRVVVGRSRTIDGSFTDRSGRSMLDGYGEEVVASASGDLFYGPGHNGEIFTDREGQDYILYHCHNNSLGTDPGTRYLMLQRLFWDANGWPYLQNDRPASTDLAPLW